MKTISLILFFTCCFLHADASQLFTIRRLGMEEGLSSNYVVSVAQDKKGYIWMATGSGLNRFDGRTFTVYNSKNSSISENDISVVMGDALDDILWIGTNRGGLFYFDYSTETITPIDLKCDNSLSNDVTAISHSSDNKLWVVRHNHDIIHYDHQKNKATYYSHATIPQLNEKYTSVVAAGSDNLYKVHNGFVIIIYSL